MAEPPPPSPRQQARAARQGAKESWRKARIAERDYARALANVGRQVTRLIEGFASLFETETTAQMELDNTLHRYAEMIAPWAQRVTSRMHQEVAQRDLRAWKSLANSLGRNVAQKMTTAPTAKPFRSLMDEQVNLIKTIPLDAAKQVHELTQKAAVEGTRYESLVQSILDLGSQSVNRARTIARTETARTNAILTQVRAEHVGSTHYTWQTSEDKLVRPDHRVLNGTVQAWAEPPIADRRYNRRAHPGAIYNCRCVAIPILPD